MTENLFDKAAYEAITERIRNLSPNAQRKWGKMNVSQMLAHCNEAFRTATGELVIPFSFLGKIMGRFFKKSFLGSKPISKNSPTAPELVVVNEKDFEIEKERLLKLITQFHIGGEERCTKNKHSFFGKMSEQEWGILMYKHTDHHLRQFGA